MSRFGGLVRRNLAELPDHPQCESPVARFRVIISPAVLEMVGVIITPDQTHFDRATEDVVRQVYREVSSS
jgi:hypothetical protein